MIKIPLRPILIGAIVIVVLAMMSDTGAQPIDAIFLILFWGVGAYIVYNLVIYLKYRKSSEHLSDKIKELENLKEQGIIDEEEFKESKKKILEKL